MAYKQLIGMKTEVNKHGILLSKTNLEFENEGVLNPAVIRESDSVHIFYRAVRIGNYSSIGYCRLGEPLNIAERWEKPILFPEFEYEQHGVEDPRITKIDDLYYLTYTAFDGINARGALAISNDLIHFEKQGIIAPSVTYSEFANLVSPSIRDEESKYRDALLLGDDFNPDKVFLWDKNVVFFPRKINGAFVFLHRIRPGIQMVSVKSLNDLTADFWRDYLMNFQEHIFLEPRYPHESCYIGSGCPPIETEHGWLLIYHSVSDTDKGRAYSACAALMDIDNPLKEIARLPHTLFSPEHEWEQEGYIDNVVFPTGTALFGDTLYIYYGAADSLIATASLSISALVKELIGWAKK